MRRLKKINGNFSSHTILALEKMCERENCRKTIIRKFYFWFAKICNKQAFKKMRLTKTILVENSRLFRVCLVDIVAWPEDVGASGAAEGYRESFGGYLKELIVTKSSSWSK